MKPPKFLICKNEMVDLNQSFLYHTQKPRFFGKLIEFNELTEFENYLKNPPKTDFCTVNGASAFVGTRTVVNDKIVALCVLNFFDEPGDEIPNNGDMIQGGLMARTGDWIHAYYKHKNSAK